MSDSIDPNGFGRDVERALERVDALPEGTDEEQRRDKLRRDRTKINEYVYGVEDSLASGTLRTRIGRLRRIAEQTEAPLAEIASKTTVTTTLGKMSRERGFESRNLWIARIMCSVLSHRRRADSCRGCQPAAG